MSSFVLNTGVKFYSYALDGSTPDNPTVSTISSQINLRTTGTLDIDTAANSQLDLTGVIYTGSGWTRGKFIAAVGSVSLETVKQYIENQKGV